MIILHLHIFIRCQDLTKMSKKSELNVVIVHTILDIIFLQKTRFHLFILY